MTYNQGNFTTIENSEIYLTKNTSTPPSDKIFTPLNVTIWSHRYIIGAAQFTLCTEELWKTFCSYDINIIIGETAQSFFFVVHNTRGSPFSIA